MIAPNTNTTLDFYSSQPQPQPFHGYDFPQESPLSQSLGTFASCSSQPHQLQYTLLPTGGGTAVAKMEGDQSMRHSQYSQQPPYLSANQRVGASFLSKCSIDSPLTGTRVQTKRPCGHTPLYVFLIIYLRITHSSSSFTLQSPSSFLLGSCQRIQYRLDTRTQAGRELLTGQDDGLENIYCC
jgi:hypothetical protein